MFGTDRPVKRRAGELRGLTCRGVTTFGVHTGVQNTGVDELRALDALERAAAAVAQVRGEAVAPRG